MIEYTGAEKDSFVELYETAGSTDLGDLSQFMHQHLDHLLKESSFHLKINH